MMLAAAAALFGTFLLISLYMQNGLGTGPLLTGLGFLPLAVALAAGVHVGQHVLQHAGLRAADGGRLRHRRRRDAAALAAPAPAAATSATSCPACS